MDSFDFNDLKYIHLKPQCSSIAHERLIEQYDAVETYLETISKSDALQKKCFVKKIKKFNLMTEITNPDRKYIMKFNGENIEMVYENI